MNIMYHERGRDKLYKIWHTTNKPMIIYTYTDGGSIVFADKMFPIKRGALCYIDASAVHYTMPAIPSEYDRSKIFLPFENMQGLLASLPKDGEMRRLFSDSSAVYAQIPDHLFEMVENIYREAFDAGQSGNCFDETVTSAFLRLMICLKKYTVQYISAPDDVLSKAISYINVHYREEITLDGLCEYIHISKYHFARKFKNSMGMTVMEYIRATRIESAKNMLASSNMRIEEISEACGFSGLSYFSQIFRASVGMSASQYRKNARKCTFQISQNA